MSQTAALALCLTAVAARAAADVPASSQQDLVFMHVPYNFGHTVERAGLANPHLTVGRFVSYLYSLGGFDTPTRNATWSEVNQLKGATGDAWSRINPGLGSFNNVTGCPTYFTPQKYWPKDVAARYFGNKTVFGLLRDPYERLVAMFRGNISGYGGTYPKYFKTCNVNGAVKQMMKDHLNSSNKFRKLCTFVPQAEYFEGPYGITVPVDNLKFPKSMNTVFSAHGYSGRNIAESDVMHVHCCQNSWSADLDNETRSLVQQVYARDFALICKHFGRCDLNANTCLHGVPQMCPTTSKLAKIFARC